MFHLTLGLLNLGTSCFAWRDRISCASSLLCPHFSDIIILLACCSQLSLSVTLRGLVILIEVEPFLIMVLLFLLLLCSTVFIVFAAEFCTLAWGKGHLVAFLVPRVLQPLSARIILGDFGGLGRTILCPAEDRFTAGSFSVRELWAKVIIGIVVLTPPKFALAVSIAEVAHLAWTLG
jgi:hypothetical protein